MSRAVINLTQTTSASYLLLASLDISRRNLALRGQETMARVAALAEYARAEINNAIGDYDAFSKRAHQRNELFRLRHHEAVRPTLGLGLAGIEVYDLLRDEYGIRSNSATSATFWPMCPSATASARSSASSAPWPICAAAFRRTGMAGMLTQEYIPPQVVLSPQDAFYGRKVRLPLAQCEGPRLRRGIRHAIRPASPSLRRASASRATY